MTISLFDVTRHPVQYNKKRLKQQKSLQTPNFWVRFLSLYDNLHGQRVDGRFRVNAPIVSLGYNIVMISLI